MITPWYFKNVRWQRHDLKFWDMEGKGKTKREGKFLLLAFATCRAHFLRLGHFCAAFNAKFVRTFVTFLYANNLVFY